jgi:hypothetical protein
LEYWNGGIMEYWIGKPGIMECWNNGILGKEHSTQQYTDLFHFSSWIFPSFHYSTIPSFQWVDWSWNELFG